MMGYYKPCRELNECNRLIDVYFNNGFYKECFEGHMQLAEKGYPLAECQIGYFYLNGLGCDKDLKAAFKWTSQAALHGDRDAQYNLAEFYLNGIGTNKDMKKAEEWLVAAAAQNQKEAIVSLEQFKHQVE